MKSEWLSGRVERRVERVFERDLLPPPSYTPGLQTDTSGLWESARNPDP